MPRRHPDCRKLFRVLSGLAGRRYAVLLPARRRRGRSRACWGHDRLRQAACLCCWSQPFDALTSPQRTAVRLGFKLVTYSFTTSETEKHGNWRAAGKRNRSKRAWRPTYCQAVYRSGKVRRCVQDSGLCYPLQRRPRYPISPPRTRWRHRIDPLPRQAE